MADPRILVVYYSRTGSTKRVGERLARELKCDVEELTDTHRRMGALGFLRAGVDAVLGRRTTLGKVEKDPGAYDLVVIGTPVWSGTISAPIRTYLEQFRGRFKKLAFFLTRDKRDVLSIRRTFEVMKKLSGKDPLRQFEVTEQKVSAGEHLPEVARFAAELQAIVATLGGPPQPPLRPIGPPPEGLEEELRR